MDYVHGRNKTDRFKRLRKDKLHLPSCYHIPPPRSRKDKLHLTSYYHTPWLQKDKLHFPSCYHTPLITEGQVTFPILTRFIPPCCNIPWSLIIFTITEGHVTFHLPDYGRTLLKALLVSLLCQVWLRHFPTDLLKCVVTNSHCLRIWTLDIQGWSIRGMLVTNVSHKS